MMVCSTKNLNVYDVTYKLWLGLMMDKMIDVYYFILFLNTSIISIQNIKIFT